MAGRSGQSLLSVRVMTLTITWAKTVFGEVAMASGLVASSAKREKRKVKRSVMSSTVKRKLCGRSKDKNNEL